MPMSGITLNQEEMKHFSIDKNQVLSRRRSMILNEPRLFVILCSVKQAEVIAKDHDITVATSGRYSTGGRRVLEIPNNKGTVLGPKGGFKPVIR
jgi:hypothetical protein